MSINFESLLEQAREGAPRSIFTSHMAIIGDPQGFENPTRLRLLGNAIANSPENAELLAQNNTALTKLVNIDPLGLQVLYNGTVNNAEFSQKVLGALSAHEGGLSRTPAMKNLLGSIWESCEVPRQFTIKLVLSGFVELILQDPSLETDPEIISNFKTVYDFCQQSSINAQDADDDFDTLGIRVVGNISSHQTFTLEHAKEIGEEPFTWETVILLGNLSAAKSNVEPVLQKWPNAVEETVKLIESEDPEGESEDEDDEELVEEQQEAPFDLELWGGLVRNISRSRGAAREIAKYKPAHLFTRLLSSPLTQDVASDFASAFTANCYDHDFTQLLTSEPHNGGSALIVSSAVTGFVEDKPPSSETEWALPRISTTLIEGLLADPNEGVWIKGTRALAILHATFGFRDSAGITKLLNHDVAHKSEPVKQNLTALNLE